MNINDDSWDLDAAAEDGGIAQIRASLESRHAAWDAEQVVAQSRTLAQLKSGIERRRQGRAADSVWTDFEDRMLRCLEHHGGFPERTTQVATRKNDVQAERGDYGVAVSRRVYAGDWFKGERESCSLMIALRDPQGRAIVQAEVAGADIDLQSQVVAELSRVAQRLNATRRPRPRLRLV